MPEPKTQTDGGGKKGGGVIVSAPFSDDYIHAIGDRIAEMTPEEASELEAYMKIKYGIEWKRE
jgi:hypothetical protein